MTHNNSPLRSSSFARARALTATLLNILRRAMAGRRRRISTRTTSRTGRRRSSRSDSIRCWASPAIIASHWCRPDRSTPHRWLSAFAREH